MPHFLTTFKGKLIFAISIIVAAAAIATVCITLRKPEGYRTISVEEVNGTCLIQNDSGDENAYKGMHLHSGDDVSVAESSDLTMLLDMDKYVYADENTHFWLSADGNGQTGKPRIYLDEGSELNWLKTELKENESYEVDTPNSTMAVRGTIFRVSVSCDDNGLTWTSVDVFKGQVQIDLKTSDGESNGVSELFQAGENALIKGNSDFSEFVPGDDGNIRRNISYEGLPQDVMDELGISSDSISESTESVPDTAATEEPTEEVSTEEASTEDLLNESLAFYTDKAQQLAEKVIIDIIVDDFNHDGAYEAFALTGTQNDLDEIQSEYFDGGLPDPTTFWYLTENDEQMIDYKGLSSDSPYSLTKVVEPNGDILVYTSAWYTRYNEQHLFFTVRDNSCARVNVLEGSISVEPDGKLAISELYQAPDGVDEDGLDKYILEETVSYYEYDGSEYKYISSETAEVQ